MKDFLIPDFISIMGGKPVTGTIDISGAKNSVLGLMAAALLTDEPVILTNVPYISDVLEMGHLMQKIGVDIKYNPKDKEMYLCAKNITSNILGESAGKFRASYYLWGALLARFSHSKEFDFIKVFAPGGCDFGGKRPTDFHENMLRSVLSVDIKSNENEIYNELEFILPEKKSSDLNPIYTTAKPSHGATFHWLLSVLGTNNLKTMYSSSIEPEVSNLFNMLKEMGLEIEGGHKTGLIYKGKNNGLLKGGKFKVMPDRIETGTYALLALGTKGNIKLKGTDIKSSMPWFNLIRQMVGKAAKITYDENNINLDFRKVKDIKGEILQVSPFPGHETDLQQIWAPILSTSSESSVIIDAIWSGRYTHINELKKMGLNASYKNVPGVMIGEKQEEALYINLHPSKLHPGKTLGTDLRGTMATIVGAAMAKGESVITDPSYALRGYPNLVENLINLGIDVKLSDKFVSIKALPEFQKIK